MRKRIVKRLLQVSTCSVLVGLGGSGSAWSSGCRAITDQAMASLCANLGQQLPLDFSDERAETHLTGKTWISNEWRSTPFMLKTSEPTYTVRTSLAHLFAYRAQRHVRRDALIDAELALGTGTRPVAAAKPPVDLWTTFDFDRTSDDALVRGGFGADLRVARGAVVGLAMQRGQLLNGDDEQVITYFKQRVATGMTWSLQGGWGRGLVETADDAAEVSNGYLNARVTKEWGLGAYKLAPSLEFATNIGEFDDGSADTTWSHGRVVLANRISRSYALAGKARIEPFMVITRSLEAADGSGDAKSLESGFKLDAADQFSLSATTGVKRSESDGETALSGRLQLKVPLN